MRNEKREGEKNRRRSEAQREHEEAPEERQRSARGAPEERQEESRPRVECEHEDERMKRERYEEERLREEREEECGVQEAQEWSEEGENDELKFDQESAYVNRVVKVETQATSRANETERYMVWWRNSWWIRIRDRPTLRTAKGRRRTWRAASRAVDETDGEKWKEREMRKCNESTLHVVLHLPNMANVAAPAAATAATAAAQYM